MKLSASRRRYTDMKTEMPERPGIRRKTLPERLADGDPDAPREMVEAHYPELFRYARAMLRDPTTAEDVVHETFVSALEALGKYRPERVRGLAVRAWLYRISLNHVRDHFRRSNRRREVPLPECEPGADGPDLDGVMDALDALARLPQRQRVAVTLRHMQDLPYAEIAAATGWPENTAKTLVRRGIATLRKACEIAPDKDPKEER